MLQTNVPCTGSPDCDFFCISTHALEAAPTAARSLLVVSPGSAPGALGSPPASKSLVTLAMIRAFSSSPQEDSTEQRSRESRTYC